MKLGLAMLLILTAAATGCAQKSTPGGDKCTLEAIGEGTGAASLRATLRVPEQHMTGVEISNGGIAVELEGCDFMLNAFISDETARYIIENAPRETLADKSRFFYLVDASLFIWKFADASGEPRFFVMRVQEMAPILRARNAQEAEHFSLAQGG